MTGALVLLVILLAGGAYGAWWYNQQQYYVGVHDGYVAIFRGTNQSVAGVSLSSLLTPPPSRSASSAPMTRARSPRRSPRAASPTPRRSSPSSGRAGKCHSQWTALATWQTQTVKYRAELAQAAHSKPKIKVPAAPTPARCPPSPARRTAPRPRRSASPRRHCPRRRGARA